METLDEYLEHEKQKDREHERMRVRQKRLEEQRVQDFRTLLGNAAGRSVLWWIINELTGALSSSFNGEETHAAAYVEGRRAIGLELWKELERADPNAFVQMLSERFAEQQQEAARAAMDDKGER